MDYKEKYEMALEGIQEILGSGEDSIKMSRLQLRLQGIFPELKESEDERIRQKLIDYCDCSHVTDTFNGIPWENVRAWLEKQGKQKPDGWSEEDEEMFDAIIANIQFTQKAHNHEVNQVVYEREIDWLKSIKERCTWKPTDKQMKQLGWIAEQNKDNMIGKELMSLYQDLLKLKE